MRKTMLVALVAWIGTGCGADGSGDAERSGAAAADRPSSVAASAERASGEALPAELASVPAEAGPVVVYKSPTCGCCNGWIDHLREHGFEVRGVDVAQYGALAARKQQAGVPGDLGSCHTAVVDGYAVEGHVPAHVIARLLDERPDVKGIAVPGMPIGSPGMEGPNPEAYQVIAFDDEGNRSVFAEIDPRQPASDTR